MLGLRSTLPPMCHADAALRLKRAEIPFTEIIRVEPDAILYRLDRKAMTAWMRSANGRDEIVTEPGFPCEPGAQVPGQTGTGWE